MHALSRCKSRVQDSSGSGGTLYIRYGEPNYQSQSGRVPALTSPKVQQIKEMMYADLYNVPPQGELVGPVFPIRTSRGITLSEREDFSNEARGINVDEDRTRSLSDPQSQAKGNPTHRLRCLEITASCPGSLGSIPRLETVS
jgi:hypothetical protein